jgi:8-oxo-dGTP diphosphatase
MNRPKVGLGIFIFNSKSNKFLVGKRIKEKSFGLPGGTLEYGESFEGCGKRELFEETNIDIDESRFRYLCSLNCISKELEYHWVEIFIIVHIKSEEEINIINKEPHKSEDWVWLSFDEIQSLNTNNQLFVGLKTFLNKFKIHSIQNIIELRAP